MCYFNLFRLDDVELDVRVVFMKFVDSDIELLFDLMLYMGEEVVFWSIFSFDKMFNVLSKGIKIFEGYCFEDFW